MENSAGELIDLQEALERLDNDMGLYMILVDAFLQDTVFQAGKMRELARTFLQSSVAESPEAARYIHRLKGAARQLGANPLADQAQRLEDVFRGKAKSKTQDAEGGVDTEALVELVLDLHAKTMEELGRLPNERIHRTVFP